MSTETVLVSEVISATRERLYSAWLDSDEHSAFTADTATIEPFVGGSHTSFSGYASGQILALEPGRKIIQSWRTSDFPSGTPDSRLEITFEETLGGTEITLLHTAIPAGQSDQYRDGWLRYYFAPMKAYFARQHAPSSTNGAAAAPPLELTPARTPVGSATKAPNAPRATLKSKAPPSKVKAKAAKPAKPAKPTMKAKPKAKAKAAKPVMKARRKPAKATTKAKPAAKKAKPAAKKAKPSTKKPPTRKPAKKKPARRR